jgi:hypothetical protein
LTAVLVGLRKALADRSQLYPLVVSVFEGGGSEEKKVQDDLGKTQIATAIGCKSGIEIRHQLHRAIHYHHEGTQK